MWGDIAISFLLAFIISFMLTPWTIELAHKIGAIDIPKDNRRMHNNVMPKLGRNSCNFRICNIYCILIICYDNRGKHRYFWTRTIL